MSVAFQSSRWIHIPDQIADSVEVTAFVDDITTYICHRHKVTCNPEVQFKAWLPVVARGDILCSALVGRCPRYMNPACVTCRIDRGDCRDETVIDAVSIPGFRPAVYLLIVVVGLAGGLVFSQRTGGVFSCQAGGYGDSRYLAYCGGSHYGDYDHGAFWFELEPAVGHYAGNADALFLGNSRMQVAFSSRVTDDWFSSVSRSRYLLGFIYDEPMMFTNQLLHRFKPKASLYIINLDFFFRDSVSEPARTVMTDPTALSRYREKRRWQVAHRLLCGAVSVLCGKEFAWYRSEDTGAYLIEAAGLIGGATTEDLNIDEAEVQREAALARPFLTSLGVSRSCIVFTLAPYKEAPVATQKAVAAALGISFVAPHLDGLHTIDGSHLDVPSAERWSAEFFRLAGPSMKACLDGAGKAS